MIAIESYHLNPLLYVVDATLAYVYAPCYVLEDNTVHQKGPQDESNKYHSQV